MGQLPPGVAQLIENFRTHRDHYCSPAYNETLCRIEFINPFFAALGWDVENKKGYADAYREVYHEDAVKVGSATKAPDYSFRIGGQRKFFLEAKKPGVNLKSSPEPAYQLRRYAWSANLPLSILTDFEEFAVYDCRSKPFLTDKASTARIFYCRYDEYAEHWDHLLATFSPEAVLKGSFDKFVAGTKGKRGTAEVDAAFLAEIESWRESLAKAFAKDNTLSQRDLNFAVQRTIDRIIFLRICEDRGIEPYGQLQALLNGDKVYARLCTLFQRADEKYNSGIFHFHKEKDRHEPPDELTPGLLLEDKPLKDIIKGLYYPQSPYEFSVLTADILGQVYEQFLGKVIRLSSEHRAVVEEKPEVRKAGGVYYTPTYIVRYIVENTLGKLLEGRTPKEAAKLKVLDPACGSGSFLIGAYQHLLDWHAAWYAANSPEKYASGRDPAVYQGKGGAWRLTINQRKRILLNSIHGVDIDPQAVETTKLSLLLKVLEEESQETLDNQYRLFRERALPDLGDNIKCGNSLIGPDFYADAQMLLLGEEEKLRVNVFDWAAEFPEVFKPQRHRGTEKEEEGAGGGFDAVIGNPPYIRVSNVDETIRGYLYEKFAVERRFDLYITFVHRGLELLKSTGLFGFILPNKFLTADYGAPMRHRLSEARAVRGIIDFGDSQVFSGATTYTCLLFLGGTPSEQCVYQAANASHIGMTWDESRAIVVASTTLGSAPWSFAPEADSGILKKLAGYPTLGTFCDIQHGLQTGCDDVFLLHRLDSCSGDKSVMEFTSKAEGEPFSLEAAAVRRVVKGAVDVRRYFLEDSNRYVLFPYRTGPNGAALIDRSEFRAACPLAFAYLDRHAATLKGKEKPGDWYGFRRRNYDLEDGLPRLLVPSIGTRACFAPDLAGTYHFIGSGGGGGGGYGLNLRDGQNISLKYLLGVLNSRLIDWRIKMSNSRFGHGYYSYNRQYIELVPIRAFDTKVAKDRAIHDRLVTLVDQMLSLHQSQTAAKTPHAQESLGRQIQAVDAQIDALVYQLYGLSDAEIAIVEAATAGG